MKFFPARLACPALLFSALLLGVSTPWQAAVAQTPPKMTIKIFNDDPKYTIFPVLTTGKGDLDIWLQAIFKVPKAKVDTDRYPRRKNYRIYINPTKGIPPNGSVTLTLPLYTQLVASPVASKPDQYIDWWNGGTILLYSNTGRTPPKALQEALKRKTQRIVKPFGTAKMPSCTGCVESLDFFSDDSDLPKNDPSQLLEYTLGARVDMEPVANPAKDPPNTLDLKNVDFDVSYVNIAALPAAMGPFKNDQVGYVGTPQNIDTFKDALSDFLRAYPGWPRFVRTYEDGTKETILKLASPLEVFARLGPSIAPPDLEPPPAWPSKLWGPIQDLRTRWKTWAGTTRAAGKCPVTDEDKGDFCDAIVDAKKLMIANYNKYRDLFAKKQCNGTPITLTDDILIAHVYGWAPFTEAKTGTGCGARANLLEDTPGYSANGYAEYLRVKQAFDKLNYGTLPEQKYVFNPWVQLIHGKAFVNAPNVYAYSVDDAVGNIQAEAEGLIINVSSTEHLENRQPASPPITVNYAIAGPGTVKMTHYRICQNVAARDKVVNPKFSSFIINANDPENCPVYFYDNKNPQQLYTFKITKKPPFAFFEDQTKATWSPQTAQPIDCTGNNGTGQYRPSSRTWCCNMTAQNGAFAYSTPEPHNAHKSLNHFVILHGPERTTTTEDRACTSISNLQPIR